MTEISQRVVLGTAALGGLYHDITDADATATVDAAWTGGIRAFDTAPHYGLGVAERRLGAALAQRPRDEYLLQTKTGRLLVPDTEIADDAEAGFPEATGWRRELDYTGDGMVRSIAESLHRLGSDRLDFALVHDPEPVLETAITQGAPALAKLRAEGVIAGFGLGTNYVETGLAFVERTEADRVLIAGRYSLLDRRAEPLLAAAAERGVHMLIAGVLNSGMLAGAGHGPAMFNYAPASAPLLEAAAKMEQACVEHGTTLLAAALQFPGRHPAVGSTVLGAGTPGEVEECLAALGSPIPDELWPVLDGLVPDQSLLPARMNP